jgi:hypothetical protein
MAALPAAGSAQPSPAAAPLPPASLPTAAAQRVFLRLAALIEEASISDALPKDVTEVARSMRNALVHAVEIKVRRAAAPALPARLPSPLHPTLLTFPSPRACR